MSDLVPADSGTWGAILGVIGAVLAALSRVMARPIIRHLRERNAELEAQIDAVTSTYREKILDLERELHEMRVEAARRGDTDDDRANQ